MVVDKKRLTLVELARRAGGLAQYRERRDQRAARHCAGREHAALKIIRGENRPGGRKNVFGYSAA